MGFFLFLFLTVPVCCFLDALPMVNSAVFSHVLYVFLGMYKMCCKMDSVVGVAVGNVNPRSFVRRVECLLRPLLLAAFHSTSSS